MLKKVQIRNDPLGIRIGRLHRMQPEMRKSTGDRTSALIVKKSLCQCGRSPGASFCILGKGAEQASYESKLAGSAVQEGGRSQFNEAAVTAISL